LTPRSKDVSLGPAESILHCLLKQQIGLELGSVPYRLEREESRSYREDYVTMPLLKIHHKTEYRYTRPVAFGEHRAMLRPSDSHDQRVFFCELDIKPQPTRLRWIHDVFGNSVTIASFDERVDTLTFTSNVIVQHKPAPAFTLTPDDPAYFYPFLYDAEEFP